MSDLPAKSELLLQNMFEEGELQSEATHKEFLSVRREGKRDVPRTLEAIGPDILAIEKEAEGLLDGLLKTGNAR